MPVPHSAKDHPGDRERRRQRHADHVDEVVVAEPLSLRETLRVQEHRHVEFDDRLPHRVEAPVVEVESQHVGADLHPAKAEVPVGFPQHLDGQRRVGHRHVRDGGEPVGPLPGHLGEPLVLNPVDAQRLILGQPVEVLRRRHREQLHVHTLRVHVGEPLLCVLELGGVEGTRAVFGVVARRLGRRVERSGFELLAEVWLCDRRSPRHREVRVGVDAQASGTRTARWLDARRELRPPHGRSVPGSTAARRPDSARRRDPQQGRPPS